MAALPQNPAPLYVADELIVTWRTSAAAPAARARMQQMEPGTDAVQAAPPAAIQSVQSLGMTVQSSLFGGRMAVLKLPAVTDVASSMALLATSPDIEHVEPNIIYYPRQPAPVVPTDTYWNHLWGLHNTGQPNYVPGGDPGVPGGDLNMLAAWDPAGDGSFPRTGKPSVTVAIIDDAFDVAHPDLAFVKGRNISQGGEHVHPTHERQSHGTMVAGSLSAVGNNGRGMVGTTWHSSIMPIKIGTNGSEGFTSADIRSAIDWACDNGAHIINASFGGPTRSPATETLIRSLADGHCAAGEGVLFVTSAGNDDANLDASGISYPTLYDAPNILNVAATNRQDDIASFSMYGPTRVHVAAPGLQIATTTTQAQGSYVFGQGCGSAGGQCGVSGTSFSSPYVAGIAALIKAHVTPEPDWREIKARLIESGSGVQRGVAGERTVGGRVDAARALDMTPRPSLVIESVQLLNDANQRLDPGESAQIEVTLRNIWKDARNVRASLVSHSPHVESDAAETHALGDINGLPAHDPVGASKTVVFDVEVLPGVSGHHHVPFTVLIEAEDADGAAYEAQRPFRFELARLERGEHRIETFQSMGLPDELYDEYHSWHIDVPAVTEGHTLIVQTRTQNDIDIDLLGRKGSPPQYYITLSIDPYIPGAQQIFCTSSNPAHPSCYDPETEISGEWNGDEDIRFFIPAGTPAATYYFTVVNYAQRAFPYEIAAELRLGDHPKPPPPSPPPPRLPSDDGGAAGAGLLMLLLGLVAARRRGWRGG